MHEYCKELCNQEKKESRNVVNMMFKDDQVNYQGRKINVLLDLRVHLTLLLCLTVIFLIIFFLKFFIILLAIGSVIDNNKKL